MKCQLFNLSYLEVPLDYQLINWNKAELKNNMWFTAQPLFKTISLEFEDIINYVASNHRQVTPFEFTGGLKNLENWNNSNQNLFFIDIDDGLSLHEAKVMFGEYQYLIYTTKSHRLEKKGKVCDRFRVIFPAVNVPRGDEYFETMRVIEEYLPFIDVQVNTKTGAFLGNTDCEYLYNDGKAFDFAKYIEIKNINKKREEAIKADAKRANNKTTYREPQMHETSKLDIPIDEIKQRLNGAITAQVVSTYGYVVKKNMFKMRVDEKTPSASIRNDGYIKDFGSDFGGDIIAFLMYTQNITFAEACNIVAEFVGVSYQ